MVLLTSYLPNGMALFVRLGVQPKKSLPRAISTDVVKAVRTMPPVHIGMLRRVLGVHLDGKPWCRYSNLHL